MAAMAPGTKIPQLETHNAFLATQDLEGYRDLAYALLSVELALADSGIEYDRDDNNIGAIQAFEAPGVERTVARDRLAERADSGAAVEDQEVAAAADLETGRVAAVARRPGAGTGNRAADPPKADKKVVFR